MTGAAGVPTDLGERPWDVVVVGAGPVSYTHLTLPTKA